ncbi:MAG: sulfurtransferase TusA family protein [Nocardioides sp.]
MLVTGITPPGAPMTTVPDQVLDCTGLQCPLPVIKTSQAVKTLAVGQVLELLATDPGVEPDMNAWTRRTGNELVGISKDGDVFHVLIRRAK